QLPRRFQWTVTFCRIIAHVQMNSRRRMPSCQPRPKSGMRVGILDRSQRANRTRPGARTRKTNNVITEKMPPSSKTLTMAAQYSAGAGGSFHEVRVAFGVTQHRLPAVESSEMRER